MVKPASSRRAVMRWPRRLAVESPEPGKRCRCFSHHHVGIRSSVASDAGDAEPARACLLLCRSTHCMGHSHNDLPPLVEPLKHLLSEIGIGEDTQPDPGSKWEYLHILQPPFVQHRHPHLRRSLGLRAWLSPSQVGHESRFPRRRYSEVRHLSRFAAFLV